MWVAIVGSRDLGTCQCAAQAKHWPPTGDEKAHAERCPMVVEWLRMLAIVTRWLAKDPTTGFVSGGASGADTLAMQAAVLQGVPKERRKVYEPKRGPEPFWERAKARNQKVVDQADVLVAVFSPGPRSPGTSDSIQRAKAKGIPTYVWDNGQWLTG